LATGYVNEWTLLGVFDAEHDVGKVIPFAFLQGTDPDPGDLGGQLPVFYFVNNGKIFGYGFDALFVRFHFTGKFHRMLPPDSIARLPKNR
jgi:hypothetical protein